LVSYLFGHSDFFEEFIILHNKQFFEDFYYFHFRFPRDIFSNKYVVYNLHIRPIKFLEYIRNYLGDGYSILTSSNV
jgi:hypothetical protein